MSLLGVSKADKARAAWLARRYTDSRLNRGRDCAWLYAHIPASADPKTGKPSPAIAIPGLIDNAGNVLRGVYVPRFVAKAGAKRTAEHLKGRGFNV